VSRKGLALTVLVLVASAAAACGGGGGGGGGGGSGDLVQEANKIEQLINRLKALPETATTEQQFIQQLAQIRDQVQTSIGSVNDAEASDELGPARDRLASRLQGLRTQLGRVAGLANEDVEAAKRAIGSILSIGEIEDAIQQIRDTSGASG
jgi:replication fork clamp-binding protein CrfC